MPTIGASCEDVHSHTEPFSICIADRRALWRYSLEAALASSWPMVSVISIDVQRAEPVAGSNAVAAIVLLGGAGLASNPTLQDDFARIEKSLPKVPILIISDEFDSNDVSKAMQLGAKGYLAASVSVDLLIQCLRLLAIGGTSFPAVMVPVSANAAFGVQPDLRRRAETNLAIDLFTPREIEVLAGLGEGKPNKIIAYQLAICETTVKVHMRHIMRKLGAVNRTQAALLASEMLSGMGQRANNHSGERLSLAD